MPSLTPVGVKFLKPNVDHRRPAGGATSRCGECDRRLISGAVWRGVELDKWCGWVAGWMIWRSRGEDATTMVVTKCFGLRMPTQALKLAAATVRIGAAHGEERCETRRRTRSRTTAHQRAHRTGSRMMPILAASGGTSCAGICLQQRKPTRSSVWFVGPRWLLVSSDSMNFALIDASFASMRERVVAGEPKSFDRPDGFNLAKAVATEHELLADGDGVHSPALVLLTHHWPLGTGRVW